MLPTVACDLTTQPTNVEWYGASNSYVAYSPGVLLNHIGVPAGTEIVFNLFTIPKVVMNPSFPDNIVSVTIPNTFCVDSFVASANFTAGLFPLEPLT